SNRRQRIDRCNTADPRGPDRASFSAAGGAPDRYRDVCGWSSGIHFLTATTAVRVLMLVGRDITFCVGSKELISDISASFTPGGLHLIVGPNGAGKSTLVKVLARLLRPQTGAVEYEAVDVARAGEAELAKRRAVLSQAIEIAFPLTVREVVMMGRYPHFSGRPGPTDEHIVDEVMHHFDVVEFTHRYYQSLSGGERQRVNFARVLAQLWDHASVDSC